MQALISTAISSKKQYGKYFVKEIEQLLVRQKVKTTVSIFNIDDRGENGSTERSSFDILDKIKSTDMFIGEMSMPSQTMGFQLAYALNMGKSCLYLYPDSTKGNPQPPLLGNPSRLLTIRSYNKDNLEGILKSFLKKTEQKMKAGRLTFVSTKEINKYIAEGSKKNSLSKGELLRKIIEEYINSHPL